MKFDIGIIGALEDEVSRIVSLLENKSEELISGIKFYTGSIYSKNIVVAKCGVGKVFASLCAEAMIIKFAPALVVNTGVGGGLSKKLKTTDIAIADNVCQHDMDTSPLGDPKGMISGINKVYFACDRRAVSIISESAGERGYNSLVGTVASGDRFISSRDDAELIAADFGAVACEMEGGAIAQVCFVNDTPVAIIRAISDNADEGASLSYSDFLPIAVRSSVNLTLDLIKKY